MNLELVESIEERLVRKESQRGSHSYVQKLFHAFIRDLENTHGKRVLEIGAFEDQHLAHYFASVGAEYHGICLNPGDIPRTREGNFMNLEGEVFDVVISSGVFEEYAIDRWERGGRHPSWKKHTNDERLAKLYSLLRPNGWNVIGTISDPCIFSNREIEENGFDLKFRINSFYGTEMGRRSFSGSELLIMRRD